ncbi:SDR family NAD(P)-dependent oxidoreductase [Asticcacaulis excentricus]|uniref:D-xylose 1-dehydrogenase n=1 Tax=Asticcacaulis excentricus (strain ATCC 15261 / DSM 4724 / KCTC 12464 / NCIMB 9791 / VKM B-1370 / CB 48) TaxID=573065 RepID=E8RVF7_ASTEC|nr:short-chain dehydrogenase/reductase SDR [Asticcacaulis excentricus CB 48]
MRFSGKTILITGAASGIGLATAQCLAGQGAQLALIDRNAAALEAVATELRALALPCDVSEEAALKAAYDTAFSHFGYVDGVVNVAGAMIYKGLDALTGDDWQRLMAINFYAAANLTQRAFSTMARGGVLVFVGSIHTHQTSPLVAPYAAAKAALSSLARTASIEGKSKGIRANAVLPGAIDTPMLRDSPNIKSGAEVIDPADIGQPNDIAASVAFLLGDEARFITGTSMVVDGGRLAKL